jgi:ABC-2 type transport system permease protein
MQQSPAWEIVEELKRQYEVASVAADGPIVDAIDVLIAPMPSSLTQPQLDHLTHYAKQGKPVLLIDDPLPIVNPSMGANEMRGGRRGMMQQAPPEPKGNFREFYRLLGLHWDPGDIAWDTYRSHPSLPRMPEEIVFVGRGSGASEPFSTTSPITAHLQDLVLLFPGSIRAGDAKGIQVTPLLTAGRTSGVLSYGDVWRSNPFFGGGGLNPHRKHIPGSLPEGPTLAVRAQGKEGDVSVDVVFIADLDLISEQFFDLRRRGLKDLSFDNVTFVLNAVDALMRDEAMIELRTRRPRHRTLEVIEDLRREYDRKTLEEAREAESKADKALTDAQANFDREVAKFESRTDLDPQAKEIMAASIRDLEVRKHDLEKQRIEAEKEAAIDRSRVESDLKVLNIQRGIRWAALGGASLPALIAAIIAFTLGIRRQMEVRR